MDWVSYSRKKILFRKRGGEIIYETFRYLVLIWDGNLKTITIKIIF